MSSFRSICRGLMPFISRATFFISSCFGLSRKRIFISLKTPNIFRTFQEPRVVYKECNTNMGTVKSSGGTLKVIVRVRFTVSVRARFRVRIRGMLRVRIRRA
jgi:hypothetical protein